VTTIARPLHDRLRPPCVTWGAPGRSPQVGVPAYEGHGIVESGSLDGATVDSARGYHVIEAQGVLQS
jgi:hypothetical protein